MREGCEVETSKEEKHNPTCAWLRQSPYAPGSYKLSRLFAEALPAPKSSLIDWPLMASGIWPMCGCPFNSPLPNPCHYTQSQRWRKTVMASWQRVDSDSNSYSSYSDNDSDGDATDMYWLLNVGGVIRERCGLFSKIFSWENYTSYVLLAHSGPERLHVMIFWKWPTAAILNLEAWQILKLYKILTPVDLEYQN